MRSLLKRMITKREKGRGKLEEVLGRTSNRGKSVLVDDIGRAFYNRVIGKKSSARKRSKKGKAGGKKGFPVPVGYHWRA